MVEAVTRLCMLLHDILHTKLVIIVLATVLPLVTVSVQGMEQRIVSG